MRLLGTHTLDAGDKAVIRGFYTRRSLCLFSFNFNEIHLCIQLFRSRCLKDNDGGFVWVSIISAFFPFAASVLIKCKGN